jgi:TrkA domain protein
VSEIRETRLPGVGVRHDFVTSDGRRVGVLVHRTGRRELLVYDTADPDACQTSLRLTADDARTLADLLGASRVSEEIAAVQRIEGLVIDWLPVAPSSACAGHSLQDAALRTETGVSIVAVIRDDTTIAAPAPDFVLEAGDIAVAVGTAEGVDRLFTLLQRG